MEGSEFNNIEDDFDREIGSYSEYDTEFQDEISAKLDEKKKENEEFDENRGNLDKNLYLDSDLDESRRSEINEFVENIPLNDNGNVNLAVALVAIGHINRKDLVQALDFLDKYDSENE